MTDYLQEAKASLKMTYDSGQDCGPLTAIAEALVALVERLDTIITTDWEGKTGVLHIDDGRG